MTTYISYQCDTCRREIQTEVDIRRPTFNKCNITYQCAGKLIKKGESKVRKQLLTTPVSGITDWRSRFIEYPNFKGVSTSSPYSLLSGGIFTVACLDVGDTLPLQLQLFDGASQPFKDYTFVINGDVENISGADNTAQKNILRFQPTDTVKVFVDGVELEKAVMAQATAAVTNGEVTAITINQDGDHYDVAPAVSFTGFGVGAAGIAVLDSDGVAEVLITNGGQGYTTPPNVSFNGGVTTARVFYLDVANQKISFSPRLLNVSEIKITVTNPAVVQTVTLNLTKQTVKPIVATGAWDNISQVVINTENLAVYATNDFSQLSVNHRYLPLGVGYILLANGNNHTDRATDLILNFGQEFQYVTNMYGKLDFIMDDVSTVVSILPPISVIRNSNDVLTNTTTIIKNILPENAYINGPTP